MKKLKLSNETYGKLCNFSANFLGLIGGSGMILNPNTMNTGLGILSIAGIGMINTLLDKCENVRKKLATCVLGGNAYLIGSAAVAIASGDIPMANGIALLGLVGASATQCLRTMGVFNSNKENYSQKEKTAQTNNIDKHVI